MDHHASSGAAPPAPHTRFDHIAIAMPRMADATDVLVGVLGGAPAFGTAQRAFTFGQWRFAGKGRLEIIEPRGTDGFLHRFLAQRGPGIHHVTFKVPSLRKVCDRAEGLGYTIVGYDDSDPAWSEAFLHPKQALGIVVQFAESRVTGSSTPRPWQPPPGPPSPPPAVTVLGLRLRARARDRVRTQWEELLEGEASEDRDGAVVYRWPRSPLRLVVEIDPAAEEGPLAVEFTSDRPVVLPAGPLGGVFRQLPVV